MTKSKYLFPEDLLHNRGWFLEIQKPLAITVQDIKRDFTKFVKDFPVDIIPHQSDQELLSRQMESGKHVSRQDIKRNLLFEHSQRMSSRNAEYSLKKITSSSDIKTDIRRNYASQGRQREAPGGAVHYSTRKIAEKHINLTFDEIKSERIARLTGLVSHFVYWCVFGHINQMPLDDYHLKQLFISIAQSMSQL